MGIGFHPSIRPMTTRRFVKFRDKRRLQLATCLQWLFWIANPALIRDSNPPVQPCSQGYKISSEAQAPIQLHGHPFTAFSVIRCGVPLTLLVLYHRIFCLSSKILKIFNILPLQPIIPKRFYLIQNFKKQWIRFNIVHCIKIPTK